MAISKYPTKAAATILSRYNSENRRAITVIAIQKAIAEDSPYITEAHVSAALNEMKEQAA